MGCLPIPSPAHRRQLVKIKVLPLFSPWLQEKGLQQIPCLEERFSVQGFQKTQVNHRH